MNNAMADETISCGPTPDMPPTLDPLELAVERRLNPNDGRQDEARFFTIFRVPAHVREENRKLYEPRLVSVGPYYRRRDELRATEQHKWRYLRQLLRRTKVPLRALVRAVRGVESRARDCYSEAAGGEDGDFAEMLLLDGCFVLEFFFKWHRREPDEYRDVGWRLVLLRSDLLLMENQLPFFVLEALFDALFRGRVPRDDLLTLLLVQLGLDGAPTGPPCPRPTGPIHHLLHLYHEAFVPVSQAQPVPQAPQPVPQAKPVPQAPQPEPQAQPPVRQTQPSPPPAPRLETPSPLLATTQDSRPPPWVIPCVSTLRYAGVRFKKKRYPRDMFDITFDGKAGVMQMPYIMIDQANLPLLVNLVVFEQSRTGRSGPGSPLTSYAALMSWLVRTGKDVEELQAREIVDNLLSSDDEAAKGYFQSLGACSTLNYKDHLFAPLFADVKRYHDNCWHRHRARFVRDYCSNPWSVIALVVAVLLFFFSLFNQTVSVYNLAHPQQPPATTHG